MSKVNNRNSRIYFILLAVNCALYAQAINATEWWDSVKPQSGFSEFAPPAEFSEYSNNKDKKQWRSGSSFNEANKVRYVPVSSKNPWKPVNSLHYKKSFGNQRPWGNVPDRKPTNNGNMKFHDQRFKQWSHQLDSSYRNNIISSDPFINNRQSALPFVSDYGFPGSFNSSPLIPPAIYPGGILNRPGYGMYPVAFNPYGGFAGRPWGW